MEIKEMKKNSVAKYKKMRNNFLPKKVKVIFILESPPYSGKYFYNSNGSVKEKLFSSMMKTVFRNNENYEPKIKIEGLEKFKKAGYFLIDSTYEPINQIKNKRKRNNKVLNDFPNLIKDLKDLKINKKTKIILIKANVCDLLEQRLLDRGYNVINKGIRIPFPSHGHYKEFNKKIRKLLFK